MNGGLFCPAEHEETDVAVVVTDERGSVLEVLFKDCTLLARGSES